MAETYLVSVACHNPQGPVSTAASIQVAFATPNYLIQEIVRNDVPWRNDVITEALPFEAGECMAPTKPGLGVEINEREAAKHPFQNVTSKAAAFHRDGSVADW
jgi:galactonate dehydratase